jgi:hypothetical protein
MSEIQVGQINSTDGSTAITTGADGYVSFAKTQIGGSRNKIINGGMRIDQRNAGASVTPTGSAYTLDRWQANIDVASKLSFQQSTTAPTGFVNSVLITSLSAYSIGVDEQFNIQQRIEGTNAADLGWGTADAKTVTLSFWVRSSLTGTFGGSLRNSAQNRSYPFTYSISVANTFEYKTVEIEGDTSGTWLTTNGSGVIISFSMGAGSNKVSTAGSWAGADYRGATGQTNLVATNGATFYITGVQLEVGTVATPFEHRSYGEELALCQRYYWKVDGTTHPDAAIGSGTNISTTRNRLYVKHPVPMRTQPTASMSGTMVFGSGGATAYSTSIQAAFEGVMSSMVDFATSGLTVGYGAIWYMDSSNPSYYFQFDAEL